MYLIYANNMRVNIQMHMMKLQIFASRYKPVKPNTEDKKYIIATIAPYTPAVRVDLKTFLLSFCALK